VAKATQFSRRTFGLAVRRERERRGISQEEFAEAADVHRTYISSIELGKVNVGIKIRLIEFGRFAAQDREKRGEGKPETFTFLGFAHYCGKRRSNGAMERSSSGGKRRRSAWWPSCMQLKQDFASECMSRLPTSVHGSERL